MIRCATGHRPSKLGGYDTGVKKALRDLAKGHLSEIKGLDYVISGMALGWDQAYAQAAYDLGIPFWAAIPCAGQESMWPYHSRIEYQDLLRLAARVEVITPGPYEAWKMHKRNEWMVDKADEVDALWDGSRGGTYDTVKYAEWRGKKVVNLWNTWEALHGRRQEA